ncbi:hypothetical protein ES288_D08G195100v1 [Gossypium darwinii]|uniref:Uncharacterized protein n=1 Tax=Gossypium darwinii TaxID=34276 RepID=A0A5D2BQW7_GOSDA|nr:hypothetical protein ES288_D08G195100v1 [Gossypium darwinii]
MFSHREVHNAMTSPSLFRAIMPEYDVFKLNSVPFRWLQNRLLRDMY